MRRLVLFAMTAVLLAGCGVSGMLSESDKETEALVASCVDNHEIYIEVSTIYPQKGRPIQTADGYYLSVKDGVANSYLPFFGESYMAAGYGDSPQIEYKDCPVEVSESVSAKGKHTWTFSGMIKGSLVTTSVEFFSSGSAEITCTSSNRSIMRYLGTVCEDKREK